MRLTEMLISILIVSLIVAAAFMSYGICLKCTENVKVNLTLQNEAINIDSAIRKKIRNIKISYLDNFEDVLQAQTINILSTFEGKDNFSILSVENLKDEKSIVQGLKIRWRINEKEFLTCERLNTRNITGDINEQ